MADGIPPQDVPEVAAVLAPPHNLIAAMHEQFSPIPALPHLLDTHDESPTRWRRQLTDLLPLLGPDYRDVNGCPIPEFPLAFLRL